MTVYDNLINAQQLHNLPAKSTWILDVRHSLADFAQGRRLYAQSHLPNAHFIDIETDLSGEKRAMAAIPCPIWMSWPKNCAAWNESGHASGRLR